MSSTARGLGYFLKSIRQGIGNAFGLGASSVGGAAGAIDGAGGMIFRSAGWTAKYIGAPVVLLGTLFYGARAIENSRKPANYGPLSADPMMAMPLGAIPSSRIQGGNFAYGPGFNTPSPYLDASTIQPMQLVAANQGQQLV